MSPVVKRDGKFSLNIRTREKGHLGRPHAHAEAPGAEASIDLYTFEVLESTGFNAPTLNRLCKLVERYSEELRAKWSEIHGEDESED